MVKIRLHGTREENEKMKRVLKTLEKSGVLTLLSVSEGYVDRGESKYERVYLDVPIAEGQDHGGRRNHD